MFLVTAVLYASAMGSFMFLGTLLGSFFDAPRNQAGLFGDKWSTLGFFLGLIVGFLFVKNLIEL